MERVRTPAQVYEDVSVPAMFPPSTRELLDVVPPRAGERVLDLACGTASLPAPWRRSSASMAV